MSASETVDPFSREPSRRDLHRGPVVAVALGGAIGGPARYLVGQAWPVRADAFPTATLIVNVVGSFVLCLLLVFVLDVWPPSRYLRPFVATGIIGSFTTYGSVMVEVDQRVSDGRVGLAGAYLAISLAAGMSAAYLGLFIGRRVSMRVPRERGDLR